MLILTFCGFFASNSAASTSGSISSCLIAHFSFEPNININPLRTVAAYMRHGNNNITICKQIAVTSPLFTL